MRKKLICVAGWVFSIGYAFLVFRGWDLIGRPSVVIGAPLMCALSLPLSILCIYLERIGVKRLAIYLGVDLLPVVSWGLLALGAYIMNSYFGADLFLSLGALITGGGSALVGLCLGSISFVTVMIYNKMSGGKNESSTDKSK